MPDESQEHFIARKEEVRRPEEDERNKLKEEGHRIFQRKLLLDKVVEQLKVEKDRMVEIINSHMSYLESVRRNLSNLEDIANDS